jgi:hypothetical protein
VSFWEAPQTVPQRECGVTRREVEPYGRRSVFELIATIRGTDIYCRLWKPSQIHQDHNFDALNPGRIDTDLMVGAMDNSGKPRPRPNVSLLSHLRLMALTLGSVFYVKQKNLTSDNPNYAKTRAIQFAR